MTPPSKRPTRKQTYKKRYQGRKPSSIDWLQILDIDGPFLAAPVITDTWPDGLPTLAPDRMHALRAQSAIYDSNVGARDGYIRHVLANTLDWRHNLVWGPGAAPYAVTVPEHQTTVDITFAMLGQDDQGITQPDTPLLIGAVIPPGTSTTGRAPSGSSTWPAGPADRLAHAMRRRNVPLGLVVNGNTWTLVTLTEAGAVSTATWTRHGWLEESETLRAFAALLDRKRFLGVADKQTLPGLIGASLARQEEVTERLSEQSQAVVEMLVATLGRADAHHREETGRPLLPPEVGPAEIYQASVTVLMRLVFFLYAEERGLLPLDDDTYATTYAVSTLAAELQARADEHGEGTLERTSVGWHRLLALFRAVHRGIRHEQLLLPAYGGSLCDPDRFPWLEGRTRPNEPLGAQRVPAIDDRTLLRALDSLQTLQFAKEVRQVSYRSLDVEQIGYVYEGLLDQDARRAEDWVVSIAVSERDLRKNGPELALTDLEEQHQKGGIALATWLHEQTKKVGPARSKASILKCLEPPAGDERTRYARLIREACGNDDGVAHRLMPFCRLLRLDPRDLPVVYPPGSLYLTDSDARANTGAVYTPRFLAEQVVQGALEPLVYNPGPLDTEDKGAWRIKTPEQILALKVADIAAGSGAFLVAATRYLAEKLLEARSVAAPSTQHGAADDATDAGYGRPRLAVERKSEDQLTARRAVIDHCIYGVDINPMAIEMAKLSLWLISLDRNRPFGFLDDRLAVGDSLLGVTNTDQIRALHLDPKAGRRLHRDTLAIFDFDTDGLIEQAAEIRDRIAGIDLRDIRDADQKKRLLEVAQSSTERLCLLADGLVAASLSGGTDGAYLALASLVSRDDSHVQEVVDGLREYAEFGLTRPDGRKQSPAHFPLLFPEVFAGGRVGFDAIVGNPPFVRGRSLAVVLGEGYGKHLLRVLCNDEGARTADLVAYFVVQCTRLLQHAGCLGLIATNSVSQGDTAETGLRNALERGLVIYKAISSMKWPTAAASVHVSVVWGTQNSLTALPVLDGRAVSRINEYLRPGDGGSWNPAPIAKYAALARKGSEIFGDGFLLSEDEARTWIAEDDRYREVLFPYFSARDLLQSPTQQPSWWVINFFDWPVDRAATYPHAYQRVLTSVKPIRDKVARKARRERWWQYGERAKGLYSAIGEGREVIALGYTTNTIQPSIVPGNQVFTNGIVVLPDADRFIYGLLSATPFNVWAYTRASTLKDDMRLAPSDIIATFPFGAFTERGPVRELADALQLAVRRAMRARMAPLTNVFGLLHDENCNEPDILELRDLREQIDDIFLPQIMGGRRPPAAFAATRFGQRHVISEKDMNELYEVLVAANKAMVSDAERTLPRTQVAKSGDPTLFGDDA